MKGKLNWDLNGSVSFDLVRWSQLDDPWVDIEAIIPSFRKGKNEYLPIPLYEINLSRGSLKQNPGW